jgi:hypothetical protein
VIRYNDFTLEPSDGECHAIILFRDTAQFDLPFAEVAAQGAHVGVHGEMIANVATFRVSTETDDNWGDDGQVDATHQQ